MSNEYDYAVHTLWLDNGRWLRFSKLIDDKNMAEMRTGRVFPLIDGNLRDTLNTFKSAWAIAGISNYKHLVRWLDLNLPSPPEFHNAHVSVRLYIKRDEQVSYSDTDGSYVTTFYLRMAPEPETLGPEYPELIECDWDDILQWLHDNFGMSYAYMASPGGAGRTLHCRQQGRHIIVETRTYMDV